MRDLVVVYLDKKVPYDHTKYEVHCKNPHFFSASESKYQYFHIPKSHPKFKQIFEAYSLSAPLVKYLEDVSVLSGSPQTPVSDSEVQPVGLDTLTQDNVPEVATDAPIAINDVPVVADTPVVYNVPLVPDNYESMEWVELKQLASHFIQGRFNKQQALEVLAEAKLKQ